MSAAHSDGLLIIARGTFCEARVCSKYRMVPMHEARFTSESGGQKMKGKEAERQRMMFQIFVPSTVKQGKNKS